MTDTFTLLQTYDARCEQIARNLPLPSDTDLQWQGVGFKLNDIEMAIAIEDVIEIVDYALPCKLPMTKSWFHGIANIRGTLAAITDFREMLFDQPSALGNATRILLLRTGGTMIGLLVDEVTGIRTSANGISREIVSLTRQELEPFVIGSIKHDTSFLPVLSYAKLVENPKFLSVQESLN